MTQVPQGIGQWDWMLAINFKISLYKKPAIAGFFIAKIFAKRSFNHSDFHKNLVFNANVK